MKTENRKIESLKPYAKNAKKHSQSQIDNVAQSIQNYGFVQPIVIDKNGVIVIGHCRYEAAKKLNMLEVPCVCVSDLTDEQVKALRIIDNKTNESPWDMDFLSEELEELNLSEFSLDFGNDKVDENDVPEVYDKELRPYEKVHYLVTLDVNKNDEVIELIKKLEKIEGVEIDSTLN